VSDVQHSYSALALSKTRSAGRVNLVLGLSGPRYLGGPRLYNNRKLQLCASETATRIDLQAASEKSK